MEIEKTYLVLHFRILGLPQALDEDVLTRAPSVREVPLLTRVADLTRRNATGVAERADGLKWAGY